MKKVTVAAVATMVLVTGASSYELRTSLLGGISPGEYMQTYNNPTYIMGIADAFDREMEDTEARHALSKRLFDATNAFHAAMIKPSGRGFNQLGSNRIDFLAIPMLEKTQEKITLNDYTTRLRKDAIDAADGKIWVGGVSYMSLPASFGELTPDEKSAQSSLAATHRNKQVVVNTAGVLSNTLAAELLTLFQEARKLDVEMDVLMQLEKAGSMSDIDIASAVESFNIARAGKNGLDHELGQCYGYLDNHEPNPLKANDHMIYLEKATEVQKRGGIYRNNPYVSLDMPHAFKYGSSMRISSGIEYLNLVAERQRERFIPYGEVNSGIYGSGEKTPYWHFIAKYPTLATRPTVSISDGKCLLPALKKLHPEVWKDYDPDATSTKLKESFNQTLWGQFINDYF